MATSPLAAALKPTSEANSEEVSNYDSALQQMATALENRKNRLFDPQLLALAQGFAAPTQSGSFFESIGHAAKSVGEAQKQEEQDDFNRAKMRIELAQMQKKAEQEKQMRSAGQSMFTPIRSVNEKGEPVVTYEINKNSLLNLVAASADPLETAAKYAKMIPDLRKAGMIGITGAEGTPFDAIVMMAPTEAIKKQAEHFVNQYKKGLIDEDKANTLAQQMLQLGTSHMDREQAAKFNQMMAGLTLGIREEAAALARQKFTDKKQAEIDAKTKAAVDVDDLLTEMKANYDALKDSGSITTTTGGVLSNVGAAAKTSGVGQAVGRVLGTETQSKIGDIETMKPLLLQAIKNATGMSATQMNSNAELKFYLNAATDPKLGYETNVNAIKRLQKMYGFESLPQRINPQKPEQTPPVPTGAAPTAVLNGRTIIVKDGKWVYKDTGKPAE